MVVGVYGIIGVVVSEFVVGVFSLDIEFVFIFFYSIMGSYV